MAYRKTERELDRLCQRRERVVTSACELVQRAGFAGAKAREIAEVAGVSVGSLYSNFNGIVELHAEVFRRLAERELRRVATEVEAAERASDALAVLVRGFGTRSLNAPRLAWALLLEPVGPDVETLRLTYRRDYADLVASIVREGMEAGEFSAQSVEIAAAAVVGAISESLVRPLDPALRSAAATSGQTSSLPINADLIEEILHFCLRGVGAKQPQAGSVTQPDPEP